MADDDEFEEDEQLDEEDLGDEETDNEDEESDIDDEESEDDEDDQDDEQVDNANKLAITHKLKQLEKNILKRPLPVLTPNEKKVIKQGKQMNIALAKRVDELVKVQKARKSIKGVLGGGSVIIAALPVLLVIFVVIGVVSMISSIFGSRHNDDGTPAPVEFALNGNQIYAARAFYTDDAAANKKIINDYCGLVASAIEEYNSTNSEFTLNITLPSNDFDYSEFLTRYTDTQYGYYRLARLSYIFAQNVNLQYGLNKTETNFDAITDDIQFFGLEQSVFNESMQLVANEIVKNGENGWYTPKEENTQPNMSTDTLAQNLIDASNFEESTLTTKVFVVDKVLEGDNTLSYFNADATENKQTKKYLAIMYFPRVNFSIGTLSYAVVKTGEGDVMVHYGENVYALQSMLVDGDNYIYESNEINLNVSAVEKPVVLLNNESTLSELYMLIKEQDEQNLTNYFSTQEQNGKNIYSYKLFNLYAEFDFDDYFSFADQNNMN